MKTIITKQFWVLIIAMMMTGALRAQVTDATFDSTWAAQFQQAIDNAIATSGIKGTSVAQYFPGQGTFIGVAGESRDGVPVTSDMQFCIGSNTKLFTSVILLKLQELGVLSLDDPISDWIPSYVNVDPSITIRQLLLHQSGIADWLNEIPLPVADSILSDPYHFFTIDEELAQTPPAHFAPGTEFRYSNTNYLLAGLVIESATANSYVENLHQYILDPLNMDNTFLGAYEEPNGNVIDGWYLGEMLEVVPLISDCSLAWSYGAIYSTPKEMTEWYDNLFTQKTILNQSSLDQLLNFEPTCNYGLGITVNWFNPEDDAYVHGGALTGFLSVMGYDKKSGGVTCVMINDMREDGGPTQFDVLIPVLNVYYNNFIKEPDDAGILTINKPYLTGCTSSINPEVVLKNFGSNPLTSATINYQVDGGPIYTYNWSGNLASDVTANVQLPQMTFGSGSHEFNCYTSNPNGNAEGFTFNDGKKASFIVNQVPVSSINEGFEGAAFPPAGWLNGLNVTLNWHRTTLSSYSGDASVVKNNAVDNTGRTYDLDLPAVDVSNMQNPVLSFYYAYADWATETEEAGLEVLTSTDCGATYQGPSNQHDDLLSTAPASAGYWYPTASQWRQTGIDLPKNTGEVWIRIRDFSATTNNLYLDEIKVADQCSAPYETSAKNVKASAANAHWKYNGDATSFTIFYEVKGSNVWNTKTAAGVVRSVKLTGLLPGTSYDGYVIAFCSLGSSPHSATFSFTTPSSRLEDIDLVADFDVFIYPNPVSNSTTISFSLLQSQNVSLKIFDVNGRLVSTLADNIFEVGEHQIEFNAEKINAGIYFLKMQAGEFLKTEKLIVTK